MDVDEFVHWIAARDRDEIEWMVEALRASCDTADGQVERLRGGREIARELRRQGQYREGCQAAHAAVEAAMQACERTALRAEDRAAATRFARAAADAARVLVARVDSADAHVLLRPFLGAATVTALAS